MEHKEAILKEVNNIGLDEITRRIALALLDATPAELLGEITRFPVLEVLKVADVSMAELELSFDELTLVRSIKSGAVVREPHAVLQNVCLANDGATLVFRICPGMRRVIDKLPNSLLSSDN